MTQAFSLWGELTVRENFVLDARLYQIPPAKAKARIDEMVHKFGWNLISTLWLAIYRWVCVNDYPWLLPFCMNPRS